MSLTERDTNRTAGQYQCERNGQWKRTDKSVAKSTMKEHFTQNMQPQDDLFDQAICQLNDYFLYY